MAEGGEQDGFGKWLRILAGPLLALIGFLVAFYLDPLNFAGRQPLGVLPAFMFSVIILLIDQNMRVGDEMKKVALHSDKVFDAVKTYLHIISIGSPEKAMDYVHSQLPAVREVKNTSFNIVDEHERAGERFYDTEIYRESIARVASQVCRHLLWKDIGDRLAISRMRDLTRSCEKIAKAKSHGYRYRLITHSEPQINFMLLEFLDGSKEVLFNWDFRGTGQDPIVLLSRDRNIVEMFSVQFTLLWRSAAQDHDNTATKSTSEK